MVTTQHTALTPDELRQIIKEEITRRDMTQSQLSRESGINQSRLSQWLLGKYRGNTELIEQELTRWLNSAPIREQITNQLRAVPHWKPTPTANSILGALRYAQQAGDISLVYGGAGLGKTCTARRYQEENTNVWLSTMTPAMSTVTACLKRISMDVGLPETRSSAVKLETTLIQFLERTNGLLIIDEAQHLPITGLEAIRSLHDASGVGLAFMGNESVYTRITGGSRQAHFAQLFSRVGYRIQLTRPTCGDVETLISSWNVKDKQSYALCMEISKKAGALRGLTKVLRLASMMLGENEETLTIDHIQTAWAELGGI